MTKQFRAVSPYLTSVSAVAFSPMGAFAAPVPVLPPIIATSNRQVSDRAIDDVDRILAGLDDLLKQHRIVVFYTDESETEFDFLADFGTRSMYSWDEQVSIPTNC